MLFFFIEFHFPNANFQQGNKIRVKYPYKYIQKNNRRLNSKQTRQFSFYSGFGLDRFHYLYLIVSRPLFKSSKICFFFIMDIGCLKTSVLLYYANCLLFMHKQTSDYHIYDLNKLESLINWTLNKLPMEKICVNLTCINRAPVYSEHRSLVSI
jgi:hypothetical protein